MPVIMLKELIDYPPINLVLAKQAARFEIQAIEEKTRAWKST